MKLQKYQKLPNKIIQRKLKMNIRQKYLKKDIYLQHKDKKIIDDLRLIYGIIMEY